MDDAADPVDVKTRERVIDVAVSKALSTYRQMSIETATPAELVLMLYNHAIRSMREATVCLEGKDVQGSNRQLQKAQDIVDELRASLNPAAGEKIAQGLDAMYEYVNHQLLEANIRKDASLITGASRVMAELRDGWAEAIKRHGSGY